MTLKILIIEKAPFDVNWINTELNDLEFAYSNEVKHNNHDLRQSLNSSPPDLILYGYCADAVEEALEIRNAIAPSVPFLLSAPAIPTEQSARLRELGVTGIATFPHEIKRKINETMRASQALLNCSPPKVDAHKGSTITVKKKKAVLEAVFENCMEGILLSVTDGSILAANPAACEMFQMTEQEIITAGKFGIVDMTDTRFDQMLKDRSEQGRSKGEIRLLRKDGSIFPAIVSSVVDVSKDGLSKTVWVIRDISEYRNTQDQLAQTTNELREALGVINKTFDASMDMICAFDYAGRFVQVNAACKTILGYEPEELMGTPYLNLVHPPDIKATLATDEDIRNGNPVSLFENRFVHKTGKLVSLLWTGKWDQDEKLTYCTAKDISEKKRLERAFEIERQRFIDLYHEAPSCMGVLKGPNHVFEMANPLYLQLIQKTDDIMGRTVLEVLPELVNQGIFELLDEVYQTGQPFIASEKLVSFDYGGDGTLEDTYLTFIYQAHRNSDGIIDGILFFGVNVTEQVLSRKKIEETKSLYKQLIKELPVATFSCDADGKIVIFNKAAVKLWGRKPVIGKDRWYDLLQISNDEGNQLSLATCPTYIALKEGRTTPGTEVVIQAVNGERRYIIPHAVPYLDADRNITGAVNMLTDVTDSKMAHHALRASEKKYRQIVETAQEGICLIDCNGKTTFVNQKMCSILGYDQSEMIGTQISDFIADHNDLNQQLSGAVANGYSGDGQLRYRSKNGQTVWMHIAANPILDSKGVFEGTLIMATDITESKIAEIRLEQQNLKLTKANNELDRFVYSVSHDLRSPMTSISGLISIIEQECREHETLAHVEMIKGCVNRLDDFIRKILSYSHNNRSDLYVQEIALHKRLSETVNVLKNMPQAKGIVFEVSIDEQATFYSDNIKLVTILENLVSNAIKYHRNDGARFVKLAAVSTEQELQLTVSDNGIGIPAEFHDKIFDMFYRISARSEGNGIGLYIVKDTVEKLQGTINVHSKAKEGTTFHITLKNLQSWMK